MKKYSIIVLAILVLLMMGCGKGKATPVPVSVPVAAQVNLRSGDLPGWTYEVRPTIFVEGTFAPYQVALSSPDRRGEFTSQVAVVKNAASACQYVDRAAQFLREESNWQEIFHQVVGNSSVMFRRDGTYRLVFCQGQFTVEIEGSGDNINEDFLLRIAGIILSRIASLP